MADKAKDIALNIYINDKGGSQKIKDIQAEATKLNNYIRRNLTPGTREYNQEVKRLRGLNAEIQAHKNAVSGVGGAWDTVKKGLLGVLPSLVAISGVTALFDGAKNLMKSNADLSDSFADVMKTTGMTRERVEDLYGTFKGFNTRTSRHELLELSKVAGKLGITGVKNVSDFVRAADMINVALGEDLGDIDTVVRNLGALNNLFKLDELYGTAEAMMKVGSAINSVGASGTARESSLVDFTSRVGGAANTVGLLVDQVIGYGAVLDEAMVEAETAGTAISQFWIKMGEDPAKFAKIAGMELEQFRKLLAEDFNAAFIAVLEGLKSTGGGVEELANNMAGAGADGARMKMALSALIENLPKLAEKQKLANQEFTKGTSLMQEYGVKNDNLAAKLERLGRWFTGNFVSSGVIKAFEKLVDLADDFVNVPVSETMEKERAEVNLLVNKLILYNDNQEKRAEILAELTSKYPELVKQMNLEKGSIDEISASLRKYNKEMVNKIALQQLDEEIQKQIQRQGEMVVDQEKQLDKILQKLIKAEEKLGITGRENMDLQERFYALKISQQEFVNDVVSKEGREWSKNKKLNNEVLGIIKEIERQYKNGSVFFTTVSQQNEELQEQEEIIKKLEAQRDRIASNFGITFQPEAPPLPTKETNTISTTVTELSDEEKKKLEEAKKAQQKMLDELREIRISFIEDEREREIALAEFKADVRKRDIRESLADATTKKSMLVAIDEELMRQVSDINDKYFKQGQKKQEEAVKHRIGVATDERKKLEKEREQEYRDLVAAAELKILLAKEGTKERILAEQELILLQAKWELETVRHTENEKLRIELEAQQKSEKLLTDWTRNKVKQREEEKRQTQEQGWVISETTRSIFDLSAQATDQFLGDMQGAFDAMYNMRMANLDLERAESEERLELWRKERDEKIGLLDDELANKRITDEEYKRFKLQIDQQIGAKMQAEQERIERKQKELAIRQAKRQKALQIVQAIGNTASAVTYALTNPPGPPFSIPQAIAAGGFGTAQIAAIAATKIPEFAKGGPTTGLASFMNGGGVKKGTLGIIGEAGPEWVAPNWMLRNPPTANIIGMLEDIRVNKRMYAEGGATASATPLPRFDAPNNTSTDPELKMLLRKMLDRLDEPIIAETYIGNRKIMELDEQTQRLRNNRNRGKA